MQENKCYFYFDILQIDIRTTRHKKGKDLVRQAKYPLAFITSCEHISLLLNKDNKLEILLRYLHR